MDCLIQTKPQDDSVYQFIDKKRAEGKPYLVYMTAGANKFLRIYYGRVRSICPRWSVPLHLNPTNIFEPCYDFFSGRRFGGGLVFAPFLSPHFSLISCKFTIDFFFADCHCAVC